MGIIILGVKIIKVRSGHDLAYLGGNGGIVAHDGTLYLVAYNTRFQHCFFILSKGHFHTTHQALPIRSLGNAHRGTGVGRLYKNRIAQLLLRRLQAALSVAVVSKAGVGAPLGLGNAHRVCHGVGHRLIHTHTGGGSIAPYKGNARKLQQSLNGAVLAVLAVEHREHCVQTNGVALSGHHTVHASIRADPGRHQAGGSEPPVLRQQVNIIIKQEPTPLFGDPQQNQVIFFFVNGRENSLCRYGADVVLGGYAAEQHTQCDFIHAKLLLSQN